MKRYAEFKFKKRLRYFKKGFRGIYGFRRCRCGWCFNHHAVKQQKAKANYSLEENKYYD